MSNIDASAATLANDVAEAYGLDANQRADLTNDLLAAVDDFVTAMVGGCDVDAS